MEDTLEMFEDVYDGREIDYESVDNIELAAMRAGEGMFENDFDIWEESF